MSTSTFCSLGALAMAAALLAYLRARALRNADRTGIPEIDGGALVRAIWLGIGIGAVQMVVGVALLDFDLWDLMSVVYLDVTLALPLVAVALLVGAAVRSRGQRYGARLTRPVTVLAVLALVPAAIGWYATHVEPYRLDVDEVTVPVEAARRGTDPLTVGVIADIQTSDVTDHERAAVRRVVEAEPDLILVAGDVFQGTDGQMAAELEELRSLFMQMEAPGGAFVVPGDVDTLDELERATRGTPVEILTDEVRLVEVGDRRVLLGGVALQVSGAGLDVVDELTSAPGAQIRILLAHRPDWALRLEPDSRVDLVVAGHTHGGQIQLPGIGPLLTMSQVPREVAAGGLHEIDGNAVYVSSGVGREQQGAPQVRFLDPPSVGILTLGG